MKNIKYIISVFISLLFFSCNHEHSDGDGHNHDHKEEHADHSDENEHSQEEGSEKYKEELFLTKEQAETIGLKFGSLSFVKVNDYVKATGTLGLPPNAHSSVSAKVNGVIKSSRKFVEGNYIKKGTVIAYLENSDFIITQQEYLEAKAKLKLQRLELERQKTLVESNAGVAKTLQQAQAEVSVLEARVNGLAKQLSFLGIATSNLSSNRIVQRIAIVSPMSGYISRINFHNGMFAQSMVPLMDIISSQHLHLELDVFEKDIANIKKEQKISYTVPALGQTIYYGVVDVIGKEFNSNSKTIRVHGHLGGSEPKFLKDLFINAKIYLNDLETKALPENAIIKDGESKFIYVAQYDKEMSKIEFEKINVLSGSNENGYTAVKLIDPIPDGMQIVTKGAYYIYAQSKAGELEHEH